MGIYLFSSILSYVLHIFLLFFSKKTILLLFCPKFDHYLNKVTTHCCGILDTKTCFNLFFTLGQIWTTKIDVMNNYSKCMFSVNTHTTNIYSSHKKITNIIIICTVLIQSLVISVLFSRRQFMSQKHVCDI